MSESLTLEKAKEIEERVKKAQSFIESALNNSSLPKIILIGKTGAGKSSVTTYMISGGPKVEVNEETGDLNLVGKSIGNSNESCTEIPNIESGNGLIFIDCPGFEDSGGMSYEIYNSFLIDYALSCNEKGNNNCKILLVIEDSDFRTARGQGVFFLLQTTEKMFPNLNKSGIGLVITKGESFKTVQNYINQITPKSDKGKIENYDFKKGWCDFFSKEASEHVFLFPRPTSLDENYSFRDYNNLRNFLMHNHINDLKHEIVLSEKSSLELQNMKNQHNNEVIAIVDKLFDNIQNEFNNLETVDDFKKWLKIINDILSNNVNNIKELFDFLKKYNEFVQNEEFEKLKEKVPFDNFLNKVKTDDNNQALQINEKYEQFKKSSEKSIYKILEHKKDIHNNEVDTRLRKLFDYIQNIFPKLDKIEDFRKWLGIIKNIKPDPKKKNKVSKLEELKNTFQYYPELTECEDYQILKLESKIKFDNFYNEIGNKINGGALQINEKYEQFIESSEKSIYKILEQKKKTHIDEIEGILRSSFDDIQSRFNNFVKVDDFKDTLKIIKDINPDESRNEISKLQDLVTILQRHEIFHEYRYFKRLKDKVKFDNFLNEINDEIKDGTSHVKDIYADTRKKLEKSLYTILEHKKDKHISEVETRIRGLFDYIQSKFNNLDDVEDFQLWMEIIKDIKLKESNDDINELKNLLDILGKHKEITDIYDFKELKKKEKYDSFFNGIKKEINGGTSQIKDLYVKSRKALKKSFYKILEHKKDQHINDVYTLLDRLFNEIQSDFRNTGNFEKSDDVDTQLDILKKLKNLTNVNSVEDVTNALESDYGGYDNYDLLVSKINIDNFFNDIKDKINFKTSEINSRFTQFNESSENILNQTKSLIKMNKQIESLSKPIVEYKYRKKRVFKRIVYQWRWKWFAWAKWDYHTRRRINETIYYEKNKKTISRNENGENVVEYSGWKTDKSEFKKGEESWVEGKYGNDTWTYYYNGYESTKEISKNEYDNL